jgi:hypothetical protein
MSAILSGAGTDISFVRSFSARMNLPVGSSWCQNVSIKGGIPARLRAAVRVRCLELMEAGAVSPSVRSRPRRRSESRARLGGAVVSGNPTYRAQPPEGQQIGRILFLGVTHRWASTSLEGAVVTWGCNERWGFACLGNTLVAGHRASHCSRSCLGNMDMEANTSRNLAKTSKSN